MRMFITSKNKYLSNDMDLVSWGAYDASRQQLQNIPASISSLLPLFYDNAHSVAMIKHGMTVLKAAVEHLKPGQISVIAMDPHWPNKFNGAGQKLWEKKVC